MFEWAGHLSELELCANTSVVSACYLQLSLLGQFLIIKPARCTNLSNLFLEWNSTCFRQFLHPSSGVLHRTHSNGIRHTGFLTVCEQAVSKPVWHIKLLCIQWKTP